MMLPLPAHLMMISFLKTSLIPYSFSEENSTIIVNQPNTKIAHQEVNHDSTIMQSENTTEHVTLLTGYGQIIAIHTVYGSDLSTVIT